ncbi:MAG: hypothetical protein ACP5H2_06490 [Solirubrobacteraceae bacterium]
MSILTTLASGLGPGGLNPVGAVAPTAVNAIAGTGLNLIGSWVLGGTEDGLKTVARVIGSSTAPNLTSIWFSAAYWRVAALAAMLTLPFLFAAAIQALVRSDLGLLTRAAFMNLPLSLIGVGLAAPLTMLLLAATDQMSAAVSAVGVEGGAKFLDAAANAAAAYSAAAGSPFFAVIVGLFALLAALALAVEMLIREAAVYVVVLMLPLGFAASVWPARRVWATRLIELLVSLILSKFVIVAVLSLAGAAFSGGIPGISTLLVAMALVLLSVFAPWTLMRILPFTEIAAGAAGALRRELPSGRDLGHHASQALGQTDPTAALMARLIGTDGPDGDGPLVGFDHWTPEARPSGEGDGAASVRRDQPNEANRAAAGNLAMGEPSAGPDGPTGTSLGEPPDTPRQADGADTTLGDGIGTAGAQIPAQPNLGQDPATPGAGPHIGTARSFTDTNQQPGPLSPALAAAGSWEVTSLEELAIEGPVFSTGAPAPSSHRGQAEGTDGPLKGASAALPDPMAFPDPMALPDPAVSEDSAVSDGPAASPNPTTLPSAGDNTSSEVDL